MPYLHTQMHTSPCSMCIFKTVFYWLSDAAPPLILSQALAASVKPSQMSSAGTNVKSLFSRIGAPTPPASPPRERDGRLSSKGLLGRCCGCRHSASLNCDYSGIIAYRHHQIALRGLDARFRQSGCRSVGLAGEAR